MVRKTTETGFRELVAREGARMPRQQRSIADYVLEHLTTVPFLSVPELARRVGVSEATVVRFAQRLGYPGFSELKVELVELLQQQLRQGADGPAEDVVLDVLGAVAELEVANIRRTVDALDRKVVAEVAEAFFAADGVFSFGMGVSAHLAELAAYSLIQIGLRASCLSTRFSSPREQLVAVTPRDLVLVFSLPPYSRQALDVLDEAQRIGLPTVAVTDRLTAPAARFARWVLPVKSDNMMFTNAIAAVTVLLNALATEVAAAHREQAVAALSRINRALAEDEDVLPPG